MFHEITLSKIKISIFPKVRNLISSEKSPVNASIKLENSSECKDYGGIDASLLCCPAHFCHLTCLHFLCVQCSG